jgi:Rrf2 family protein
MRMSQGVEWSLHACALLALLPDGEALPTARLAEFFELPAAYLAKHLQVLSRAGLLEPAVGPKGGYRLARPPEQISLRDVVVAIEGDGRCFRCQEIRRNGPSGLGASNYRAPCGIARAMWRAEDAWLRELGAVTLRDLAADARRSVPRAQQQRAREWLAEAARSG